LGSQPLLTAVLYPAPVLKSLQEMKMLMMRKNPAMNLLSMACRRKSPCVSMGKLAFFKMARMLARLLLSVRSPLTKETCQKRLARRARFPQMASRQKETCKRLLAPRARFPHLTSRRKESLLQLRAKRLLPLLRLFRELSQI
jgi:hypothetical protein